MAAREGGCRLGGGKCLRALSRRKNTETRRGSERVLGGGTRRGTRRALKGGTRRRSGGVLWVG